MISCWVVVYRPLCARRRLAELVDKTTAPFETRLRGLESPEGVSVMQAATGAGVAGIVAECGGSVMCASCHVIVDEA